MCDSLFSVGAPTWGARSETCMMSQSVCSKSHPNPERVAHVRPLQNPYY
nr:MAG TPA_asm: hypothetical protein [Bacteriophage sp.]